MTIIRHFVENFVGDMPQNRVSSIEDTPFEYIVQVSMTSINLSMVLDSLLVASAFFYLLLLFQSGSLVDVDVVIIMIVACVAVCVCVCSIS